MMILDEPSEGHSTADRPAYLRGAEIVPERTRDYDRLCRAESRPHPRDHRAVLHQEKGTIARSLTGENVNEHNVRAQLLLWG
jgi:hypothetical protein